MILTKKNLKQWKKCLDKEMKKRHGIEDFSKSNSDPSWLEWYTGASVENAIDEEIECWD